MTSFKMVTTNEAERAADMLVDGVKVGGVRYSISRGGWVIDGNQKATFKTKGAAAAALIA